MTDLDLASLRATMQKRTPGEWVQSPPSGRWIWCGPLELIWCLIGKEREHVDIDQAIANAAAIAAAVNSCERLIDRVEELQIKLLKRVEQFDIDTTRIAKLENENQQLRQRVAELERKRPWITED